MFGVFFDYIKASCALACRKRVLYISLIVLIFPVEFDSSTLVSNTYATAANGNMGVSANVPEVCTFTFAHEEAIAFGTYDGSGTNFTEDATSECDITMRCTRNTTSDMSINHGENADGAQRRMADGFGNYLLYNLYQDGSLTTIWNEVSSVETTSTSAAVEAKAIYGSIPANQLDAPVGTYYDTVTVTTTY